MPRSIVDDFLDGLREAATEFVSGFVEDRFTPIAPPREPRTRRKNIKPPKVKTPKAAKAAKRERSLSTHYDTLQVARTADAETISAAYRSLCKRAHPDNWPHDPAKQKAGETRMKEYTFAYSVLKHPEARKVYDRSIR